jgi:heterodisulfide reductase subunit A
MHEPEKATEKAKRIIRMSVARAELLEPLGDIEVKVKPSALVIGGGISGMTAALSIANQGFKVYLVEKELELGGMLRKLYKLFPTGVSASDFLKDKIEAVKSHENIECFTNSIVKSIEGFVGNFKVTLLKEDKEEVKLEVGTIIVATGAEEFKPHGVYGYGKYKNVITLLELEQMLKELERNSQA